MPCRADPSVPKVSSIDVSTSAGSQQRRNDFVGIDLRTGALRPVGICNVGGASGDAIAVTDVELGHAQTVSGTFPNLSSVNGIAYDSHNNRIYVENGGTNTITVYNVQGVQQTVSGTFENAGPDAPAGIVFDPHNDLLYVTYFSSSSVTAFDEQGRPQATSGTFPNVTQPVGIAYDATDQEVFVAGIGSRMRRTTSKATK